MGFDAVYSMFGQNTRELEWFVKAGMTPAQALATATTTAAELLGQAQSLGRLAPGFAADIVAIEGRPLEDIHDVVAGVRWVMKDGAVALTRASPPSPAGSRGGGLPARAHRSTRTVEPQGR